MVLIFVSGSASLARPSSVNFQVKIGDGPATTPLAQSYQQYNYGYFMANRTGKLKCSLKRKSFADSFRTDIFIIPEKHEVYLYGILKEMASHNPEDETLHYQIEQFLYDNKWIAYTQIEIQSSPSNATVYIDGDYKGETPLKIYDVSKQDVHELCLKMEKYSEHCERFSPANKSRFNIALRSSFTTPKDLQKRSQHEKPISYHTDTIPPKVEIAEPQISSKTGIRLISSYSTTIRGVAWDQSGIVWVKINGQQTNLDADGRFWLKVNLAVGKNNFEIQASDTKNNLGRKTITIERPQIRVITREDQDFSKIAVPKNIEFGKYYALVIGNNDYKNLPKLVTAINDAIDVGKTLRDLYGFEVRIIKNGTRRDIVSWLDKLRRLLTEKDNLLIYYAGHGFFDKEANRGYWLPVNASYGTSAEWISNADITDKLKAFKAKHVMVVADSCYSGTLTRGINVKLKSPDYLKRISRKRSRTVLTSGGFEPVLDSTGGEHSVFAQAFLNALSKNRGVMDGTQLFGEIRRPVMLDAPQTPQYSDIRFAGHEGGDFLFVRK
jgi:hypothetical protein